MQKRKDKDKEKVDDQQEDMPYNLIERLQQNGINAADINKLKSGGYNTTISLIMVTKKQLSNIKGINEGKIQKIIQAVKKIDSIGFINGVEYAQKRKSICKITTGSTALDQLLAGGLQTMGITQAFGQFRTGKTQLAHTLCVTSQLPKQKGGGNGKVIYIDTQGTLPERIYKIAQRYGLDGEQTLENIRYARAYNTQHLSSLLTMTAAMMIEAPHSLLIVDSIMACFRADFTGRGELSERQQILGKTLSKLTKLAEQFNIAVYLTNQVMADPGNTMAHCDPKKPIGGHVLAHASTTRLYFKKGKGQQRIWYLYLTSKVYDSPCLAQNQTTFEISEMGISDVKD